MSHKPQTSVLVQLTDEQRAKDGRDADLRLAFVGVGRRPTHAAIAEARQEKILQHEKVVEYVVACETFQRINGIRFMTHAHHALVAFAMGWRPTE